MTDKDANSIVLEKSQIAFLEEMVQKYKLPDLSKAIRCLVNYAQAKTDQQDSIFAEIRCNNC